MHRILYLGLDPSRYKHEGILVHYPIIQTVPVRRLDSTLKWDRYSHVLFTSPTAVKHWMSLSTHSFHEKSVLSIGPSTAAMLKSYEIESKTAPFATQEGVIELLKELEIPFLFWPRSSKARPILAEWLQRKEVCYQMFDLYQTFARRVAPLPNLDEFDEIVFTSPSTVEAFLEIYGAIPPGIKISPIGPVTQQAIASYLLTPFRLKGAQVFS